MTPEETTAAVAAFYSRIAAGYDNPSTRFFPYAADPLVARLKPRPGEKFLDIGTGTGAVATADLAEPMLEFAHRKAAHLGLQNIDWHEDPALALRNWRRMLRPGGRLGLTLFQSSTFAPFAAQLLTRLAAHGIEAPFGWERLTDTEEVRRLLEEAEFTAITCESRGAGYHLARAEEWWEVVQHTDLGRALDTLDPAARDTLEREHLAEVATAVTDEGLWLEVPVLYLTAERPS